MITLHFPLGLRMEAIKKKMQAMKVEKDNLCDRCDEVEQVGKAKMSSLDMFH